MKKFLNWLFKPSNDFINGYQIGVEDEYQRCQKLHQEKIDELQKFYLKILGSRDFIKIQRKYYETKRS